jgi:hypothetical protein
VHHLAIVNRVTHSKPLPFDRHHNTFPPGVKPCFGETSKKFARHPPCGIEGRRRHSGSPFRDGPEVRGGCSIDATRPSARRLKLIENVSRAKICIYFKKITGSGDVSMKLYGLGFVAAGAALLCFSMS